MKFWNAEEQDTYDVVVVGSGAAGLLAAIAAAKNGSDVVVLERSALLGGTSAISGGTLWVPANHYMLERGLGDDREDALRYLRTITKGHTSEEVLASFVDHGPEMIHFLQDECELEFSSVDDYPDYRPDLAGSVPGGRSLDPKFFDLNELGPLREAVRPDTRLPFSMQEYEQWVAFTRFPWDELERRQEAGLASRGQAVVAPLVKTAADLGVTLVTEARATRLEVHDGRIAGVSTADGARISARQGVVLACGGFEWDENLVKQTLAGPIHARCSPPNNTGDGLRMGQRVGAKLGNLREAFWSPMAVVPGDQHDGRQAGTLLRFERQGPGSIIVDKNGRRFVNESQNYNDLTRAFFGHDPVTHEPEHLPAYIVFDEDYLERYGFLSHRSGQDLPGWIQSAGTLTGLADRLGIPSAELQATVERFNGYARSGEDLERRRGDNAYDRYWGDDERGLPNPCLAPLERGPYYAVEIVPGAFGTCGGIVTDGRARALDVDDNVIPGLYAAGNTTAHPMGGGYAGAGATLGPGMTMGYLAGRTVTEDAQQPLPAAVMGA
ncbi:FAD-dependent oxidoreductase [Georgenia subflava]|uniref:FAD-dependent oxidoreductase n=1 Tax=Georgenia subflava TaxID=1622177 RepID=A0A6N7EB09_9MICO|nr:FAD-dependent oxidoreductase [Georgenia subflava]MPV35572.1 FAD-dependent oxidoreductase [Georgenia subflava]